MNRGSVRRMVVDAKYHVYGVMAINRDRVKEGRPPYPVSPETESGFMTHSRLVPLRDGIFGVADRLYKRAES